ncbi:MAG: hypothetical protein CMB37_00055 [Euryarchaeota archaeon]|nr:hypothetical protein [Euryarchaeota archaeon]
MQARRHLVISILLMLILAPWVASCNQVNGDSDSEMAVAFPELNDAQVETLMEASPRGVTSWIKQGTANPSANNGPGVYNSVWISDVINTTNNAVIITGSYRGDVIFDSGPSPTDRDERTAFVAQLDQYGGWSWFKTSALPSDSDGHAHSEEATIGPAGVWICGWFTDTVSFGSHTVTTAVEYTDAFVALYNISQGTWDLATSWGGPVDDHANGCAATGEGSVYVVGSFQGASYFGPNSYTSEGGSDMYILQVDSMGGIAWTEAWGGDYDDNATGVVIDSIENAYVVGYYNDNVLDWPSNHILTAGRPYNGFVSKVNPYGDFLWSRDIAGGVNGQSAFALAVTYGNGDVYVGGEFSGSADFREGSSVAVSLLGNTSATNAYVAAIDTTGSWVWASRSAGSPQSVQSVTDLAVGPMGTIAVSGIFYDANQFWTNVSFGSIDLIRNPAAEGFVAGLDRFGNWMWADGMGGEFDDITLGVAWLGLGKVITAGRHCINLEFGCASSFGSTNKSTYSYMEGAGFVWAFEVDTDFDGVPDLDDNCPLVNNTNQANMDNDQFGDLCDDDADADGLDDYYDNCIGPAVNWIQSTWALDRDGDGCRDADEDDDDDGDGILDSLDSCNEAEARHNWTSSLANDYDSDGCHDNDEDMDDDSDSIPDELDLCPRYPYNRSWTSGVSNDHDGDGCDNNDDDVDDDNDGINDIDTNGDMLDKCPRGNLNWISTAINDQDGDGCQDSNEDLDDDDDGVLDFTDMCNAGALNWQSLSETDNDGDGCRDFDEDDDDDGDGLLDDNDDCPAGDVGWTSTSSTDVDGDGCRDAGEDLDDDGDKVPDNGDSCPNGKTGWESNSGNDADDDGCHDEEEDLDDDNDGFNDNSDSCPGTPAFAPVDNNGCSDDQADSDGDGVINSLDSCVDVPATSGFDLNFDGCTDDIDNDGLTDDIDACLGTPVGEQIDSNGCGYLTQQDLDGDGVVDTNDGCPGTSNQSIRDAHPEYDFDSQFGCWMGDEDSDGDGYQNWLDICPGSDSTQIIFEGGCTLDQQDEDGDGIANGDDACQYTSSGAVVDDAGCSRQQRTQGQDEGGLSVVGIIGIVSLIAIMVPVIAALTVMKIRKKQANQLEARLSVKRGEMPAPATEVAEQVISEADNNDSNLDDDPNYKVDENGVEWWMDDDQKWWYRTPEMDDWAEHQ